MEKINTPSKEDIIKYYIEQNHTIKECAEFFHLSWDSMKRRIKKYSIVKEQENQVMIQERLRQEKVLELVQKVGTKEEIFSYYISENHSIKECQQHFGICKETFLKVLRFYNIAKTCENGIRDEVAIQKKRTSWNITQEELYDLYIQKDMSQKEIANIYNISIGAVSKKLNHFAIHKDSEQILAKRQSTCMKKYGKRNPMQVSYILNKVKSNNFTKYGVDFPLRLPEVINKRKNTLIQKYGTNNISTYLTQQEVRHYDIWNDPKKFKDFLLSFQHSPNCHQLKDYFGVHYNSILRKIHSYSLEDFVELFPNRSHYEDEIIKILQEEFGIKNIEKNVRNLLDSNREIDIYLPDYKIGIEFNGDYWHCDLQEAFQDHNGRSTYHQEKSLEAEEKGIFLFHIFEHEWSTDWTSKNVKFYNSYDNIINRLRNLFIKNDKKIAARKCEVREISKEIKQDFLSKNHIQGNDVTSNYFLGLFYNNEIVSCMCFGHSKFKKYDYELTRFASLHGMTVQGAASKLFKYFVDNKMNSGETIASYNDITKTKGDLYNKLGFNCISINDPNYWWINLETHEIRSRYQEQASGEVERMHSQGFYRICDCGTKTWIYQKK